MTQEQPSPPSDGSSQDRQTLFDRWAEDYDRSVEEVARADRYPFAGYNRVMGAVCREADPGPGRAVLDLGTGTGNLARLLLDRGSSVTGTDYSAAMLDEARVKLPGATLVRADLRSPWPDALGGPFDSIVSAYVLHEFELPTKIVILSEACRRLVPGGSVVIGDIAFSTRAVLESAQRRWRESWDDSEHYWAADETIRAAESAGLCARWEEISVCAGVFVFGLPSD